MYDLETIPWCSALLVAQPVTDSFATYGAVDTTAVDTTAVDTTAPRRPDDIPYSSTALSFPIY
jgi:hypothetical protein